MNRHWVRTWRSLALRAIAAMAFGIAALVAPRMALTTLVLLFGAYALVDGMLAVAASTRYLGTEHVWTAVLEGLAGIGLGLASFVWSRHAADLVVTLVALWAIATGGLELLAAARLRRELSGQGTLVVAGAVSVVLGVAILAWPATSAFVLAAFLGCYALVFGAAMLAQALRLRQALRRLPGDGHSPLGTAPHVL